MGSRYEVHGWALLGDRSGWHYAEVYRGQSLTAALWHAFRARFPRTPPLRLREAGDAVMTGDPCLWPAFRAAIGEQMRRIGRSRSVEILDQFEVKKAIEVPAERWPELLMTFSLEGR